MDATITPPFPQTDKQRANSVTVRKLLTAKHDSLGLCLVPTAFGLSLDANCAACQYIHRLTGWPMTQGMEEKVCMECGSNRNMNGEGWRCDNCEFPETDEY
ncbi:hypothetical protein LEM8419_03519 [Neolewinella maritima]|uniref:Uncharacterized protein n=1 Tax=Neolewinella maritima TaxID=1383882 RepID=A0ABM9B6M4_9BACT|nr:hypothetical protein LEM8419_03519 [Neolewinella maritima]